MGYDQDDPFFDADDLAHNLFATGYELDQEGLAITVGGLGRDEPGDHEGLHLVDQDSLGRATRLPSPDASDVAAAEARDIESARRALRRAADRRGPDAGVPRVLGQESDLERGAGEDEPDGGADSAGASAEHSRVAAYLANPKNTHRTGPPVEAKPIKRGKRTPKFAGCTFGIELGEIKHLPSGQMKITLVVPFEDKAEALKLTDTPGLLLEASVSAVEGIIK
jgi:hypothetical protein